MPSLILAVALAVQGCGGKSYGAAGMIAGRPVATTVDSPLAKALLDGSAEPLPAPAPDPSDRTAWQSLAAATSVDTAALLLAEAITSEPRNACWRARYEASLEALRQGQAPRSPRADALVLAVPGWMYLHDPATGADLARPRQVLARLGIASELVPTLESGTVEENAAIVADAVRRHATAGRDLILLSASKGGAEVAEALGRILPPGEAAPVRAWVNVGGLLRGTALADLATTWPTSWPGALYLAIQGIEPGESVRSLRPDRSTARLARQELPADLLIVNLVGIPLSGQIRPNARFGYRHLSAFGPNDALTPIADILAHGGLTIAEPGLDHYFADPEIDLKTAALAVLVVGEMGGGRGVCVEGPAAAKKGVLR